MRFVEVDEKLQQDSDGNILNNIMTRGCLSTNWATNSISNRPSPYAGVIQW